MKEMSKKRITSIVASIVLVVGIVVIGIPKVVRFVKSDNLVQAAEAGEIGEVRRLLLAGVPVNGSGMHGMTPLMSACKGGDFATVEYLISEGADVNGHNDSGSVLMWAIDFGDVKIISMLLANDIDISWKNSLGNNALSFAIEKSDDTVIKLLDNAK